MATPVTYVYTVPVNDVVQLNTFLRTHVGDPVTRCSHDAGTNTLTVFTNEADARGTTDNDIRTALGKYPNPPKAARGPQATTVIDVAHGGTGLSSIPAGRILFGDNDLKLTQDALFAYNAAAKDLSVFSISALPEQPTSPVNKAYVDALSYLKIGKGLYLNDNHIGALDVQNFADLTLTGRATVAGDIQINSATPAVSTLSGALTMPNGGGIATTGSVYAGAFFKGTLPLATEQYVLDKSYLTVASAETTYEKVLNLGAGLTRAGGVLSVSAAQSHVTSLGTLSSLNVGGSATFASAVTLSSGTPSTSTTTGALVLTNSGGVGISGNVYANGMFIGTNRVATELFVQSQDFITAATANATFEPKITVGSGLSRTSAVLSVNSAQPGVTSLGTLTGLTLSGPFTTTSTLAITNATPATSTATGALTFPAGGGISTTGSGYFGGLFIGSNTVATENYVQLQGYLKSTTAATLYEPLLSIGSGLSRSGNLLSVNASQPGITSLGTLTGLSISGPLTSSSTLSLISATPSTSTTTGAIVLPNGGGFGTTGSGYFGNLYINTDPVATQAYVINQGYLTAVSAASTYETKLIMGTGISRAGGTLNINPAQTQVTSLGTLTGLNLSGPAATTSTLAVNNSTAATSTTTGALVIGGTGGLGVGGSVYAANMFIGTAPVATQAFVGAQGFMTTTAANTTFETKLTMGTGLSRTGATLSVNAAQTQITSLGTLTGLALAGPTTSTSTVSVTNATNATSTSTGALIIGGGGGAGISGNLYAGNLFIGNDAVATQLWVSSSYITTANANAAFEPKLSMGTGISRTGTTLSIDATQPQITSVGTLTGLNLSGPAATTSTFAVNNSTAATSTTTGAVVIGGTGGLGVGGSVYAGNMFIGTAPVATQSFVTSLGYLTTTNAAATYETKLLMGTGLSRTGTTISVNAAQPQITSVGTLTGLALSGPATSTSTISVTNATNATSTTTGALTIGGGGGVGVSGNVYAANMFIGADQVATQPWVSASYLTTANAAATYEIKLTAGTGLTRTGATLSLNAAQPQITSVGTLTGLTVSGALTNSSTLDSTAIGVGAMILQGGLSVAKNITTNSLSLASGLTLTPFTGGSWINLPTTGPSGIGTGGAGANCLIGYAQSAGHWFTNAAPGDVAYRNNGGRILWGNTGGDALMALSGDNLGLGTANPAVRLDVVGNAQVTGTLNVGTAAGLTTALVGPSMLMSDGFDAAGTAHPISFLQSGQTAAGYLFVFVRNVAGTAVGTVLVSFYKPAGSGVIAVAINTYKVGALGTLTVAYSGTNINVTTSAGCSVAWTAHFGS